MQIVSWLIHWYHSRQSLKLFIDKIFSTRISCNNFTTNQVQSSLIIRGYYNRGHYNKILITWMIKHSKLQLINKKYSYNHPYQNSVKILFFPESVIGFMREYQNSSNKNMTVCYTNYYTWTIFFKKSVQYQFYHKTGPR